MLYFPIFINSSEPKAEINNAIEKKKCVTSVALLTVSRKGGIQGQPVNCEK